MFKQEGFTLIELMLIIVISGILVAVSLYVGHNNEEKSIDELVEEEANELSTRDRLKVYESLCRSQGGFPFRTGRSQNEWHTTAICVDSKFLKDIQL